MQSHLNDEDIVNINKKQVDEACTVISELIALLAAENERNWSRGLKAVAHELTDSTRGTVEERFADARSIYNTMTAGGHGFSEYFVWSEDEENRIQSNRKLDELRRRMWAIFNS